MINAKRYNHLSFEEILTAIGFKALAWEHSVDGCSYVLHTHNYGSSPHYKTVAELRAWIETALSWQIDTYTRRNELRTQACGNQQAQTH